MAIIHEKHIYYQEEEATYGDVPSNETVFGNKNHSMIASCVFSTNTISCLFGHNMVLLSEV